MNNEEYRHGRRITLLGIVGNIFVAAVEFLLGILGRSSALIADAVHSLSDVGATLAVYVGLKYSSVPKDKNHPYGHGKIESVIAMFLGVVLGATGAFLIYLNVLVINNNEYSTPEWFTLLGAAFTIVVKEWMFRFTLKAGKRLHSPSISASAYHHRSDAFTSIGVFIGILGAYLGYPILDPVAALIVAMMILMMAFKITKSSLSDLTDITMPDDLRVGIEAVVHQWNPEYKPVETIGRRMGTRYQVNLKVKIGPYVQAVEEVSDFRQLEQHIIKKIPLVQGVDIKSDVDAENAAVSEAEFKECVRKVLDKYSNRYRSVESLEYHFLSNQSEVHFNLLVDPDMSVGDAHDITNDIEKGICGKFETAQVIIHIEPDDAK